MGEILGVGGAGIFVVLIILVVILLRSFRIAQEYERAVIFALGRVTRRPRGPGLFIVWPWERAQKVDIRTVTMAIQPQDCITGDNVTVRVDAVAYFRVVDPNRALVAVRDFMQATLQISQTTLRSVIGQVELDELLAHRAKVIHAQGELQAAGELHQAAVLISQDPAALQLRYLQTLTEIAVEKNSTIVFPMPIDLLDAFQTMMAATRAKRDN